jgi:hypothetical protein
MSSAQPGIANDATLAGSRYCGASCLNAVYASLGIQSTPDQIWRAIAKPNRFGSVASTTHLMAKDALDRGLQAMVVQVRDPIIVLKACVEAKINAIVNHRLSADSSIGHYSILQAINDHHVTLIDPYYERSRQLTHAEFLDLWQAHSEESEIAGYVLIAIAKDATPKEACDVCRTPFVPGVQCPACSQPIPMPFPNLLGCLSDRCLARLWSSICCPTCDSMLQLSSAGEAATTGVPPLSFTAQPVPLPPPTPGDPWNLAAAFAAIDSFMGEILAIPGMAENTDIKQQSAMIEEQKIELRKLQTQFIGESKAHEENLKKMVADAEDQNQAHLKRLEELSKPGAPLDPEELGRALLENLGLRMPAKSETTTR